MRLRARTIALGLLAVPALVVGTLAQTGDVWTVGVDNTRQGWNRFETVLIPATVPKLKKLREFIVDEKIDVSPLVVGNRLYVFTMTNTAYIFDVDTGAQLATPRRLAEPFDPRPDPGQMDRWLIYHNWGITATPPDLKYCVAIYCQQGWDPKTTKTAVTLMGSERQGAKGVGHAAMCSSSPAPAPRRPKG